MTSSATPNFAEQSRRIRTISCWLARTCTALIVVMPVAVLIYWWQADPVALAVQAQLPSHAIQGSLQSWQRALGAALTLLPLAMLLLGLAQARRCFRGFVEGHVFTVQAVASLRRFAGWVALSVATMLVTSTLLSVVLTLGNAPGARHLAIGLSSTQVFTLFFAAMVWLMASIIGQGQLLADENAGFV